MKLLKSFWIYRWKIHLRIFSSCHCLFAFQWKIFCGVIMGFSVNIVARCLWYLCTDNLIIQNEHISDRYNQIWSSVLITGITTDIKRHIRLIFYCKIPAVSYSNTYCLKFNVAQTTWSVLWTLKEKELENWMQLLRKNSELSVFYHLVLRGEIKE